VIAAYALTVSPLQGRIGATIFLGSLGWTALASLASGLAAVLARDGSIRANAEFGDREAAQRDLPWCRDILAAPETWRRLSAEVARAAGVLAAALDAYREACADLESTLATFFRYPAPGEEASTLRRWATGLLAAGDRPTAVGRLDTASRISHRIDAAERCVERATAVRECAVGGTGSADGATASGGGEAQRPPRCAATETIGL
jgi:hypothetical protein